MQAWSEEIQGRGKHCTGSQVLSGSVFNTLEKPCSWLQGSIFQGVFGLLGSAINPWYHRGGKLRNKCCPSSRKGYFFRQEWIIICIKSDRSPKQHNIPYCTPKVTIPAEGNWESVKGTAANNPHSSSGAMATHGRWEESNSPAGEWSHFLHQSCFSGFLQTPRHELLHRLWSDCISRLFWGIPKWRNFFFAKERQAESLWSYDSRIWVSSSDLCSSFFWWWIFLSFHRWWHTCGKQTEKLHWARRGTDQSVITGARGKVRHFIFLSKGVTGCSHIWHLFWTLLHMRIMPVLEPFLKSAGATEKIFPRTKNPLCSPLFVLQGYLWEPGDCGSSTLENLKTFWQLNDGHKWVTLNCPGTYVLKNPNTRKSC